MLTAFKGAVLHVGTRRGASAIREKFSSAIPSLPTRTRHGASLRGGFVFSLMNGILFSGQH